MFMGFEEIDGEDDIREEFPCPFCSEHFDIVGLCCHIDDEHPVEAKNGVLLFFFNALFIFMCYKQDGYIGLLFFTWSFSL